MRMWVAAICLSLAMVAHVRADERSLLQELTEQRLLTREERNVSGLWLLGFGLLSAAGGAVLAVAGHQHDALIGAGITTASFGVVNAVLSFGLLDIHGTTRERILDDGRRGDFAVQREAELVAQLESGQFFAVNTGLDVFYLASGGLLCMVAAAHDEPGRWELGVGMALLVQGAFLLTFDIVHWLAANRRANAARSLSLAF